MPIPPGLGTKLRHYVLIAVVLQTSLAVLINLPKLRVPAPVPGAVRRTDIYHGYAVSAFEGKVPYRDFRVEYPPLAVPVFLTPMAISRSLEGYKRAFAFEMLVFNALTVWLVASRVERWRAWDECPRLAWYTLYFGLLSKFVIARRRRTDVHRLRRGGLVVVGKGMARRSRGGGRDSGRS